MPSGQDDTQPRMFQSSAEDAGDRLDRVLVRHFPQYSRAKLRQLIQSGSVLVNERRQKPSYLVRPGDRVTLSYVPEIQEGPIPEDVPLSVLFEDEQLVAIDKPSGMVVHPSKGHWQGTLTAALAFHFRQLSQVGGAHRPGIIHRLDRDTSGVILVAKTDAAHRALAKQFESRTVRKQYLAICQGRLDRDRDRIEQPIGPHPYHREKMAIRSGHASSRAAETFFEVIERFRGFVYLRALPKTGRTHQIRIHLSHVGCPILCDPLYSGRRVFTREQLLGPGVPTDRPDESVLSRLALHAHSLEFDHPVTAKRMRIESPLPEDLRVVLEALRRYRST